MLALQVTITPTLCFMISDQLLSSFLKPFIVTSVVNASRRSNCDLEWFLGNREALTLPFIFQFFTFYTTNTDWWDTHSHSHGSWDQMPDLALERLMIWARRESRRLCWCWKVAIARELEEGLSGWGAEAGATESLLVLAKQIKHLPANSGLWLVSKSLPHSEIYQLFDAILCAYASSDLCRCWTNLPSDGPSSDAAAAPQRWSSCCKRRTWIRLLLWFPLLGILSPRAGWARMTILHGKASRGDLISDKNEMIPLLTTPTLCEVRGESIEIQFELRIAYLKFSDLCASTCGSWEDCVCRSLWRRKGIGKARIHCGWTCDSWDLQE